MNIYALDNRTVNASAIEECAYIFWLATAAVKTLASTVEPMEVAKSPTFAGVGARMLDSKVGPIHLRSLPFLAEHYIDLPLGGVDDMAVWAGYMWRRWAQWLYEGPPVVPPPDAPRGSSSSSWRHTPAQARFKDLMRVLAPLTAERVGATKRHDTAGEGALMVMRLTSTLQTMPPPLQLAGGVSFAAARRADDDGDNLWLLRALRKLLLSPPAALGASSISFGSVSNSSPPLYYSWARSQADDAAPAAVAARTLAVLRDAGFGAHVRSEAG